MGKLQAAWQAMSKRDRHSDGKFVYAALTTGIYCRPSCPARLPRRRNMLILATPEEAERQGFIECRRCHPRSNPLTPAEKSIKAALDYIEAHLDQAITLRTLSQATGLSPNHLQQTFKRIVGLPPKSFGDARRLDSLKRQLRSGESISSAGYGVGYGSSRALYEKAQERLGMTPATYRNGGRGMHIFYAVTDTEMGRTLLAGTERGVCAIYSGRDNKRLLRKLRQEFPRAAIVYHEAFMSQWIAAMKRCLPESRLISELVLDFRRRVFHAKVWKAIRKAR